MSRLMSVVWTVQFFVLLASAVVSFVQPQWVLYFLEECVVAQQPAYCCAPAAAPAEEEGESEPVSDAPSAQLCKEQRGMCAEVALAGAAEGPCSRSCHECALRPRDVEVEGLGALVRMLAPFFLVFALFSGHAVMRADERTRRNLAFIFAALFMVLGALVYTDGFGDKGITKPAFLSGALCAGLAALVLFSVYSIFRADDGSRRTAAILAALGYGTLLACGIYVARKLLIDSGGATIEELQAHYGGDPAYGPALWIHERLPTAAALVLLGDTVAGDIESTRARTFAVVLIAPLILLGLDLSGISMIGQVSSNALADEPLVVRVILGLIFLNIILHAQYAAWPIGDAEQKLSGSANTRPPSLWLLWFFQGILFCGFGAMLVWAHGEGASLFVSTEVAEKLRGTGAGYAVVYDDLDELYPALFAAIGFFSFSGMHTSREWVWKAHCFIFAVFYGAMFMAILFVWSADAFGKELLVLLVPCAFLFVAHVWFHSTHREWFSEDVGQGPDGWIRADLLLGPALLMRTLVTRRRATHANGVAAEGRLVVSPAAGIRFPAHELFDPRLKGTFSGLGADPSAAGDGLPPSTGIVRDNPVSQSDIRVQIRFANERSADDAAVDARGAAVCLVAPDGKRFDLTLSTGAFSAAENIAEFALIRLLTSLGKTGRRWLAKNRRFLEGGLAALRRAPTSYCHLWYHSQSVRFWVSSDGKRNLVRYRLSPDALMPGEESGLPVTPEDYVQRRRARNERRPSDYLRRELKLRLQGKQPIVLKLQAQFHEIHSEDGLAWYDPSTDWHAGTHPWVDLGEITLESVLSDEVSEKLTFNTDNAPSSLGIPVSQGIFDPRSIADSERRVMRRVQGLRKWLISVLGLPRHTPKPVK